MKIQDILQLEQNNKGNIILHKEGIFWRAYEQSAYLFTHHIKEYQIIKKYYKNAKQDVVYLGFPLTSIKEILKIASEKKIQETQNQIIIGKYKFSEQDFVNWKFNIKTFQATFKDLKTYKISYTEIFTKIKEFPLANKTPIECQQFLTELQNEIQTF